jgi:hypothetical protein
MMKPVVTNHLGSVERGERAVSRWRNRCALGLHVASTEGMSDRSILQVSEACCATQWKRTSVLAQLGSRWNAEAGASSLQLGLSCASTIRCWSIVLRRLARGPGCWALLILWVLTVIAGANELDALRQKQQAQERARTMARELVSGILDVQLRRLAENNLTQLPIYGEIQAMREHLDELVDNEMQQVISQLVAAQQVEGETRVVRMQEARQTIRTVVVTLMAERQKLLKRLGVARLAAQTRHLIGLQTTTLNRTERLPRLAVTEREASVLTTVQNQQDVIALYFQLVASLEDVRGWGGPLADGAIEGLHVLTTAQVDAELKQALLQLDSSQYEPATQHQDRVLRGLRAMLKVIEQAQGIEGLDRTAARERVRQVRQQQEQLRDESRRDALEADTARDLFAERQRQIQKQLGELAELANEFPTAAALLEQAREAAVAAEQQLFTGEKADALLEQGRVIGSLAEIETRLEVEGETTSSEKSAAELATEVTQLEKLDQTLTQARQQQPQASQIAASSPAATEPTSASSMTEKPTMEPAAHATPTGDKPTGEKPADAKPTGEKPAGDKPTEPSATPTSPASAAPSTAVAAEMTNREPVASPLTPEKLTELVAKETEVAETLQQFSEIDSLPPRLRARLQDAQDAVEAARTALAEADPRAAELSAAKHAAVARAESVLQRAATETKTELADLRRRQMAVELGELARAAEALERAGASEQEIASRAAKAAMSDAGLTANETAQLRAEQADVMRVAEKIAAGVAIASPKAAEQLQTAQPLLAQAAQTLDMAAKLAAQSPTPPSAVDTASGPMPQAKSPTAAATTPMPATPARASPAATSNPAGANTSAASAPAPKPAASNSPNPAADPPTEKPASPSSPTLNSPATNPTPANSPAASQSPASPVAATSPGAESPATAMAAKEVPADGKQAARAVEQAAGEAGKRLTEAAATLRAAVGERAKQLQALAQTQLAPVQQTRQAIEERLAEEPTSPSQPAAAQLEQAMEKVREARLAQLEAAGRSELASAARVAQRVNAMQAAQAEAAREAEQMGTTPDKTPLRASRAQEQLAAAARQAAAEAAPAVAAPLNATADAATRAARELLLSEPARAAEAMQEAKQALAQARQAAAEAEQAAAAKPAGEPNAKAQQQVAQLAAEARPLTEVDPAAATQLASAETLATAAQQAIQSANREGTEAIQPKIAAALETAAKQLQDTLAAMRQQQAKGLEQLAMDSERLAQQAAELDAGAAAALDQAQRQATAAARPTPQQTNQAMQAAQTAARQGLEQAVAGLAARQQQLQRDQDIAAALAELAAIQQQARDRLAAEAAELAANENPPNSGKSDAPPADETASAKPTSPEPTSPEPGSPAGQPAAATGAGMSPAATDAQLAARQQAAQRLDEAARQFADAQRATGEGAAEISGQQEVMNQPVREGLQAASQLGRLQSPVNEAIPADQAGEAANAASSNPTESNAGKSPQANELGMNFVPQSPEVTAQRIAGEEAMRQAAELLGSPPASAAGESAPDGSTQPGQTPPPPSENGQPTKPNRGNATTGGVRPPENSDSNATQDDAGQQLNKTNSGDSRAENGDADASDPARGFRDELWFSKLPPSLQQAIRAKTRQQPPPGYEQRLQRYFRSLD